MKLNEQKKEYEYILFSENFYKKCNMIFAFFIVFFPVVTMISDLFGYRLTNELLLVFFVLYAILQILNIINSLINSGNRKILISYMKKFPVIISIAIVVLILISCIINNAFNDFIVVFYSYFAIFFCIFSLEKKYYKLLINVSIIILVCSCILSFIDPNGYFVWGFSNETDFPFSMQFVNPNYAGSIIAIMIVVAINLFNLAKRVYLNIWYAFAFIIFAIYLFLNGSYSPIAAMIFAIVFEIIFLWIKNKKCPIKILLLFLSIIPIMFLVDLYPNIAELRTCKYNFFLETCAVIDNILGTDILSLFGIDYIIGSDGWDRGALIWESLVACFSSFKSFLFGCGANSVSNFRPHNNYIGLFLEFGVGVLILYLVLLVYFFYKLIKTKFNSFNFIFVCGILSYLFRSMFGSIIPIEYTYFLVVFAIAVKNIVCDDTKLTVENNDTQIINDAKLISK